MANVKIIKDKALQMARDPKNADLPVMAHPEMKAFLREKKIQRGCRCCFMSNCFKRQMLSKKYKLKNKRFDECKGTKLKFKDMEETATTPAPTVENLTTSITPSRPVEDAVDHYISMMGEEEENSGSDVNFQQNVVGIYEHTEFTRDKIPDADKYCDTAKVRDKNCPLCDKVNMSYVGIFRHLLRSHKISWGLDDSDNSTYEEWVAAFHAAKEYDYENIITEADNSQSSSGSSAENYSEDPEFDNFSPVNLVIFFLD